MRIIHVITSLDPRGGGPQTVVASLAAAQAAAGHDATIVSYERPGDGERVAAAFGKLPHFDRVRWRRLPTAGWVERLAAPEGRRQLADVTSQADVVQVHGVWEPLLTAAASAARARRLPYVVAPHGMLDPWSLAQKPTKKRVALFLGVRRMLDGAAYLHVLNADERALLAPLGLRAPAEVIANGIHPEEFADLPPRGSFAASRPELAGKPYVLFLSRLHPKKGLDYLADAFAQLAARHPAVQLVVAGPDDGARADFEARVGRAGLASRVHLVGSLLGREKLAAMVDAACFCLPSRQEGFSMAITEALGCGVPVVISENCHFPEVAEAGAGVVVPLEPNAIADALAAVLSDPAAATRMGAAGRAMVLERYTWPAIARRTLDLYERALTKA